MKAIVYHKYGSPDVLELKEIKKPTPNNNEVLIKVHATTVNRTDSATRLAKPFFARFFTGLVRPKKNILGTEFAGEIEAVGNEVTTFEVGGKVFGFSENNFGAHALYMTIPEEGSLTTIPKNTSYEQAAASTEGAHYAYNFINKVHIKSGQKVLVNGASGGIGSAMVQLLKYFNADITAVCGKKNIELVKTLGANRVIDYTTTDFTKDNQKYDFVFDAVGKSSFTKCKPLLQSGGVYISSELGWMAENIFFALVTPILGNKKVIFPLPTNSKGSVLLIKKLMEQGKFKAVIDRKYPLEQIADAYRFVETGQKTGNVVISLEENSKMEIYL